MVEQLTMDFEIPRSPAPGPDWKALARLEHWRAERQRLDEGRQGCGCADCQELYQNMDLTKYGKRVKDSGGIITIGEGSAIKKLRDNWVDDIYVDEHGWRWGVDAAGKTVCLGKVEGEAALKAKAGKESLEKDSEVLCSSFSRCEAPVCPMNKDSLKNGIWYPDEPICTNRKVKEKWLAIQRRISRKAKDRNHYFVYQDFQVASVRNPRGHDPNHNIDTNHHQTKQVTVAMRGIKHKRRK